MKVLVPTNNDKKIRNNKKFNHHTLLILVKKWLIRFMNNKIILAFIVGIFVGRISITCTSHDTIIKSSSSSSSSITNIGRDKTIDSSASSSSSSSFGVVKQLKRIPNRPTSHTDRYGRPITKQVLLEPWDIPPVITGFSIATLKPGQIVSKHSHETMHELFYILNGTGTVTIISSNIQKEKEEIKTTSIQQQQQERHKLEQRQQQQQQQQLLRNMYPSSNTSTTTTATSSTHNVSVGTFIHCPPKQLHEFIVPEDSPNGDLIMIMIGVVPN